MLLNHLLGLYTHPIEEWQTIDNHNENANHSISHIVIIALIPSIVAYYSSVYLGWEMGADSPVFLTHNSAILIALDIYLACVIGVFALGYLVQLMAAKFGATPSYTQSFELAAYASTPVLMAALSVLFPQLWFVICTSIAALAYSLYLLYTGVPILMHIPKERGAIYASAVVACGLVLLMSILMIISTLWKSALIVPV